MPASSTLPPYNQTCLGLSPPCKRLGFHLQTRSSHVTLNEWKNNISQIHINDIFSEGIHQSAAAVWETDKLSMCFTPNHFLQTKQSFHAAINRLNHNVSSHPALSVQHLLSIIKKKEKSMILDNQHIPLPK